MINRKFGRILGDGIEYAPASLVTVRGYTMKPSADDYKSAGYLPIENTPANPPKGWHVKSYTWTDEDGKIVRDWVYEENAPVVRQFSKLKLYGAIAQLGAWASVQAWLEAKTINGLNGWMAFQLAQEISEDHPLFAPLAEECRVLLGLESEQFETMLNSCILEA